MSAPACTRNHTAVPGPNLNKTKPTNQMRDADKFCMNSGIRTHSGNSSGGSAPCVALAQRYQIRLNSECGLRGAYLQSRADAPVFEGVSRSCIVITAECVQLCGRGIALLFSKEHGDVSRHCFLGCFLRRGVLHCHGLNCCRGGRELPHGIS